MQRAVIVSSWLLMTWLEDRTSASALKIDIMMRTWERDTPHILMFLRSFEIFFPMHLLGGMYVILDKTKRDRMTGSVMPSYVHVIYEDPAEVSLRTINPHDNNRPNEGRVASQISNLFTDAYGSGDIIGIVDADSIFRAPAMEYMMIRDGKPKLFCSQHRDRLGMESARLIDPALSSLEPFTCMVNFPFLMWRSSFPRMRHWMQSNLNTANLKAKLIELNEQNQHFDFFGNFAIMGSYLYAYERERYHVVVGGNGPLSTCPELRPSMHVHYSMPNFRDYRDKLHWEYFRISARAIYRSLRLCSNKTSAQKKSETIHTFLSLESGDEKMFGKPGQLVKPGCDEYLEEEIRGYWQQIQIYCAQ